VAKLTPANAYLQTVTLWNRLEGRPRTADFERAMKAEVRDPLWMLSKQWQMGEFQGDDAASPVLARAHFATTQLTKYQAGSAEVEALDLALPLEAKVETQPIAFERRGRAISLDIRLLMGRRWLKLVSGVSLDLRQAYIDSYSIDVPDPAIASDAEVCAHSAVWQHVAAVAGRQMDGYRLYEYLVFDLTNRRAHDGITEANTQGKRDQIDVLATQWRAWFERLFLQPPEAGNPSWKPDYLEHQFACSAPQPSGEKVLTAAEYHHGHLDWYNLDIDPKRAALESALPTADDPRSTITRSFVPSSVSFGGMPHSRWWAFEDWNTNLGFVKPDTQDLNKLLLLDFFLVYSNDWFMLPVTLPVGTISNVRGLMVTDVFGEKTWVEAAGRGQDQDWQRWNLFTLATAGTDQVPADVASVVLPVARKVQQGKPLEEVLLVRDEVANMVWGVEARVPAVTGQGRSGKDTAHEFRNKLQQLVAPLSVPPPEPTAAVRYELVNRVPEHWIPFVPAHVEGNLRQVQLQRASLPRVLDQDPDPPKKVEPRTSLLRHGLDQTPARPYFIHEEEVTRAGVKIEKCYQRTRWYGGAVVTWLGIRKQQGRGEGRSGLAFDQLLPTPPKPASP
jgi:hypothetical protein